jgi:hypothetical protein
VRKITLRADEDLIERARLRAALKKNTLNAAFREWLQRYAGREARNRLTSCGAWDTFAAQGVLPAA